MENNTLLKALILAIGIALAGYFIGNTIKKGKEFERHVQVKGLSEREVMADLAVWPIQITLLGNDLKIIRTQIEEQKDEVIKYFKAQGFSNDEITAGITNINDARENIYGDNYSNREYRYIAKMDFTIRTTEIPKLQKALDESLDLISKGILIGSKDTWRPIEYSFSNLNEIKPSMIEEATKKAREVAEKFALDSNSKVGKIRSANQGIFSISDRDYNTPHIKIVRVVTTIEYFLKD
jgi:hypothetical protein